MEMRVICVLLLGTFVLADEVNTIEKTEISNADNPTEINTAETEEKVTSPPCDKSLFVKEDLKHMIDYMADSLSTENKLNDTIQSEAVPVVKKHVQWVQSTMNLFSNRPGHLKHVLEDISATRQLMASAVEQYKKGLEKYADFVPIFQEKVDRAKAILKKFTRYQQLCEISCGEVEFRSDETVSSSEKYCGSIAEVHKTIHDQLVNFVEQDVKRIHQEIIKTDETYNEKVHARTNDLKDIALKEFDHTMFDILHLQDEYHHLKKDLKEYNIDFWLVTLRTLNIQIDAILLKLQNVVEYYGNYCKNCNKLRPSRIPIVYRQKVNEVKKTDLLRSLIDNKIAELNNNSNAELHAVFKELDEHLNKSTMDDYFIKHLKPIQKELRDLTNKEMKEYQKLNIPKLKIDMDLVKKLIANTGELMAAIAKEYQAIVAIIRDLVPKS